MKKKLSASGITSKDKALPNQLMFSGLLFLCQLSVATLRQLYTNLTGALLFFVSVKINTF
jgi:hypothetical protein